jgi:hypothetical protein
MNEQHSDTDVEDVDIVCTLIVPIVATISRHVGEEFTSYRCQISSTTLNKTYSCHIHSSKGKFSSCGKSISKETALNLKEVWLGQNGSVIGSSKSDICIPDFNKIDQQWKKMIQKDLVNPSSTISSNIDDSIESKINSLLQE